MCTASDLRLSPVDLDSGRDTLAERYRRYRRELRPLPFRSGNPFWLSRTVGRELTTTWCPTCGLRQQPVAIRFGDQNARLGRVSFDLLA